MSTATVPSPGQPRPWLVRTAVAGSALLMLAGGALFFYASQSHRTSAPAAYEVALTVNEDSCQPNALTVPAGLTRFTITNGSQRALEWEILDGVLVLAERENIAPGLSATLMPRLAAGTYTITCGLLSNPRGTLTVTPSGDEATTPPDLMAFIGPLAEMQVYLRQGASGFVTASQQLSAAIAAGDIAQAKAAYPAASAAYARLEAEVRRYSDLSTPISATATYFAKGEADPAFTGLHRLEYGLFAQGDLAGLAPVAQKLAADAVALQQRLAGLRPSPELLAGNAADYLTALSETAIPVGSELYAGNDFGDFSAALDTVDKSVTLLRPLSVNVAASEITTVADELAAARAALDSHRNAGSFPDYRTTNEGDRADLAAKFGAVAKSLQALNSKLGLVAP